MIEHIDMLSMKAVSAKGTVSLIRGRAFLGGQYLLQLNLDGKLDTSAVVRVFYIREGHEYLLAEARGGEYLNFSSSASHEAFKMGSPAKSLCCEIYVYSNTAVFAKGMMQLEWIPNTTITNGHAIDIVGPSGVDGRDGNTYTPSIRSCADAVYVDWKHSADPRLNIKGDVNIRGADGKDGVDGKDGTVCFEDLTEAQRLSLKGEDGKDGKDGTVSFEELSSEQLLMITGPKGDPGEDGADGVDGADGADGDDGVGVCSICGYVVSSTDPDCSAIIVDEYPVFNFLMTDGSTHIVPFPDLNLGAGDDLNPVVDIGTISTSYSGSETRGLTVAFADGTSSIVNLVDMIHDTIDNYSGSGGTGGDSGDSGGSVFPYEVVTKVVAGSVDSNGYAESLRITTSTGQGGTENTEEIRLATGSLEPNFGTSNCVLVCTIEDTVYGMASVRTTDTSTYLPLTSVLEEWANNLMTGTNFTGGNFLSSGGSFANLIRHFAKN